MWIKICGIRDLATAESIAAAMPDAIGLNFFRPSPRCIDRETASRIVRDMPEWIEAVALFVNHELDDVIDTATFCQIGTVQIHGDESPEFLADLATRCPSLSLLRAFRVDHHGLGDVAAYLDECGKLGVKLAGCLIDAKVSGEYGGTGHTAPWDLLREQYDSARWPRLIVAGGLHPKNVADAIRVTSPFGVDVASGVESSKAVKDLDLVRNFIAAARATDAPAID